MDSISLSYAELAEKLGVKIESAKKLARRKNWRRLPANDGTVRVSVPLSALPSLGQSAGQEGGTKTAFAPPLSVGDSSKNETENRLLVDLELLRGELRSSQAIQALFERELADMRDDRDAWRDQAEALLHAANAQPFLLSAVRRLLGIEKPSVPQERAMRGQNK